MYAERMIIETDPAGNLKQIPKLPANCRIEAIFLVMDEQPISINKRAADSVGKMGLAGKNGFDTQASIDDLLAETFGAWGKQPVAEVVNLIEAQRRNDWGDD